MKHSAETVKATLLTILDELGDKCNPTNETGCVYYKADATDAQHNRCIIGELLHRLGESAPKNQNDPWVSASEEPEHRNLFDLRTNVFLVNLQGHVDDQYHEPWEAHRDIVESWGA